MQAQAAALSKSWRPKVPRHPLAPEAADASDGDADGDGGPPPEPQSSAVCARCGVAGCCSACSDCLRFLVAPPHARCVPRGPSYFYGCGLGFTPVRAERDAAKADSGSVDYWRQLGRMALWQLGVWLFGLLIVAMITVARSQARADSIQEYLLVGWGTCWLIRV
jgi:hypothetical protein